MNRCGVYSITCTANGKVYIGQSISLNQRKTSHFTSLKRGKHTNPILQSCYNKYGPDCLVFEVLVECPKDDLTAWEQILVNAQRLKNPESVMNIGECVDNPRRGMAHSTETKTQISTAKLGNQCAVGNSGRLGRSHSEVTKVRMSKPRTWKNKENIISVHTKPYRLEKDGQIYAGANIRQFCREHGLNQSAMSKVLRGRNRHHKGFTRAA
jgi:group I intron endonuclease